MFNLSPEEHEACLRGERIFGDGLEGADLQAWFKAEEEGFAQLYNVGGSDYGYGYFALDRIHAFSKLPRGRRFKSVCALGAARGDEIVPLLPSVDQVVLIEPSETGGSALPPEKTRRVAPEAEGWLDLPDASQDLLLCLSVLHHIPRVTRTLDELGRIAMPGALLLLREPLVSLGDWRHPRAGLTPYERGIPEPLLRQALAHAGFVIESWVPVAFPLTRRLGDALGFSAYNVGALVWLDAVLSRLSYWNLRYHARKPWQKIRPNDVYLVARKVAA